MKSILSALGALALGGAIVAFVAKEVFSGFVIDHVAKEVINAEVIRGTEIDCSTISKNAYVPLAIGPGSFVVMYFPSNPHSGLPDSDLSLSAAPLPAVGHRPIEICEAHQSNNLSKCTDQGWKKGIHVKVSRGTARLIKIAEEVVVHGIAVKKDTDDPLPDESPYRIIVRKAGYLTDKPVYLSQCRLAS